jgi:hypothetical protein
MISDLYLHSRSQEKPLRIGVIVDDFRIPGLFRQVLLDINACDFANLELVILNPKDPPPLRDCDRRRLFLYRQFEKRDRRWRKSPFALEALDSTDILSACPRIDARSKQAADTFPPDSVTAIRAHDLDVILRFGFDDLRGDILSSARCGVWAFRPGDNEFYRGTPAFFWEVVEDNPCTGVTLQVLADRPEDGLVLCKSLFATVRGLWPSRNLFRPYWGSAHFFIRKLHELHERGWDELNQRAVPPAPYRGRAASYRAPGNFKTLRTLAPRAAAHYVEQRNPWRKETITHWRICLRRNESPELIAGLSQDKSNFQWMPCPLGHFYADPFLFEHRGQIWIFFEDYFYSDKRGRINCAPLQQDLSTGPPIVCLDTPYHLSYPLVFRHDGEVFMIPESINNGSVELWRATDFPSSWKLERKLFSGSVVDTTPMLHEGRWYFFTTFSEPYTNDAFGALFSSGSLTGEWEHHPESPVSTDIRDSRSGGAILQIEGRHLRPVQDCSENYGRRIHVKEILELTRHTFRERRLHSIEPDWDKGLAGVHTYAFHAGIEVLDGVSFPERRLVAG